jgi:putative ABC transport system ATP-binding protein
MIELRDVSKIYRKRDQEIVAFRADRFEIAKGEYAAVVGPSGSGKTTMLSILGGMLSPDSGAVQFDGVDLYALDAAVRTRLRRERIGFVFQTFNLVPYLTALENVELPLYLTRRSSAEQRERAILLLRRVGLESRLNHKPCELSVGQQQRISLARTIANNPSVLLADEPTGNLDAESRSHVLDMFDEFVGGGGTVVMVTHDAAAAARAGRQLTLRDGEVTTPAPKSLARVA